MADPTHTVVPATLLALAAAAVGPLLGQYVVILVGAVGGSLLALMLARPSSLTAGIIYMGSAVLLALFAAGPLLFVWNDVLKFPAGDALAGLSFYIGLRRDWALGLLRSRVEGDGK